MSDGGFEASPPPGLAFASFAQVAAQTRPGKRALTPGRELTRQEKLEHRAKGKEQIALSPPPNPFAVQVDSLTRSAINAPPAAKEPIRLQASLHVWSGGRPGSPSRGTHAPPSPPKRSPGSRPVEGHRRRDDPAPFSPVHRSQFQERGNKRDGHGDHGVKELREKSMSGADGKRRHAKNNEKAGKAVEPPSQAVYRSPRPALHEHDHFFDLSVATSRSRPPSDLPAPAMGVLRSPKRPTPKASPGPGSATEQVIAKKPRGRPPKKKKVDPEADPDPKPVATPKRRGRPPKKKNDPDARSGEPRVTAAPKPRGRPPKKKVDPDARSSEPPRPRGRPPKKVEKRRTPPPTEESVPHKKRKVDPTRMTGQTRPPARGTAAGEVWNQVLACAEEHADAAGLSDFLRAGQTHFGLLELLASRRRESAAVEARLEELRVQHADIQGQTKVEEGLWQRSRVRAQLLRDVNTAILEHEISDQADQPTPLSLEYHLLRLRHHYDKSK